MPLIGAAHLARQTGPVIGYGVKLKVTGLSVGIGEIPQGAPAFGHGLGQHLPDGFGATAQRTVY